MLKKGTGGGGFELYVQQNLNALAQYIAGDPINIAAYLNFKVPGSQVNEAGNVAQVLIDNGYDYSGDGTADLEAFLDNDSSGLAAYLEANGPTLVSYSSSQPVERDPDGLRNGSADDQIGFLQANAVALTVALTSPSNAAVLDAYLASSAGANAAYTGYGETGLTAYLASDASDLQQFLADPPSEDATAVMTFLDNSGQSGFLDQSTIELYLGSTPTFLGQYLTSNPDVLESYFDANPTALLAYLNSDPDALEAYLVSDPDVLTNYFDANPAVLTNYLDSYASVLDQYVSMNPQFLTNYIEANPGTLETFLADNPDVLDTYLESSGTAVGQSVSNDTSALVQLLTDDLRC